jgi:hypothetical protein
LSSARLVPSRVTKRLAPRFVRRPLGSLVESRKLLAPRFVLGPLGSSSRITETTPYSPSSGRFVLFSRVTKRTRSKLVFGPLGFVIDRRKGLAPSFVFGAAPSFVFALLSPTFSLSALLPYHLALFSGPDRPFPQLCLRTTWLYSGSQARPAPNFCWLYLRPAARFQRCLQLSWPCFYHHEQPALKFIFGTLRFALRSPAARSKLYRKTAYPYFYKPRVIRSKLYLRTAWLYLGSRKRPAPSVAFGPLGFALRIKPTRPKLRLSTVWIC